jgi:O-antigen/teichoic acid export membrane protein
VTGRSAPRCVYHAPCGRDAQVAGGVSASAVDMIAPEHNEGGAIGRSLSSKTLGHSMWAASGSLVSVIGAATSTVIVARGLGAVGFGRFSYLLFVITLLGTVSEVGVNSSATSVLVRLWPSNDLIAVGAELRRLLIFGAMRAAVLALAAVALFWSRPVVGYCLALVVAAQATLAPFSIALVARRRYRVLTAASIGVTVVQAVVSSFVALKTRDPELTFLAFLACNLVAGCTALALAPWALILRSGPRASESHPGRRKLRVHAAFYISSVCLAIVFGRSETILLERSGQAVALGLFAIASTLAARATLLTDALYAGLLPGLGEASSRDAYAASRAYATAIRFSSMLVLLTAVVAAPVFVILGPIALGSTDHTVRIATAIMLIASLVQTFVYPLAAIAAVELQARGIAWPGLGGAMLDIGCALLLVPRYGLVGAAIASLAGCLAYSALIGASIRLGSSPREALRSQYPRVALMAAVLAASCIASSRLAWPAALCIVLVSTAVTFYLLGSRGGVLSAADVERLLSSGGLRRLRRSSFLRRAFYRMCLCADY